MIKSLKIVHSIPLLMQNKCPFINRQKLIDLIRFVMAPRLSKVKMAQLKILSIGRLAKITLQPSNNLNASSLDVQIS